MATWLTSELVGDGSPSGGSGFGKRTRVTLGVNLPSLEVIMSRLLLRSSWYNEKRSPT